MHASEPAERNPLVSAGWLAARLHDPHVVIVDVRWYLTGRRGADEYARGHLPGAAFADLDRDLSGRTGPGRHPLPAAADFAAFLAGLGVGPDELVVAYDDAGGAIAARLWWLLQACGHRGGRVLDGGLPAWVRAGLPLSVEPFARPAVAPLPLSLDRSRVVDRSFVAARSRDGRGVLLDARPPERHRGEVEPVDARPGHIPGARNAPVAGNLGPDGCFLPTEALVARYQALGALQAPADVPVVASCGSGVTACHTLLALQLAGRDDARLYEGSYSDWARDASLPVALGEGT